MPHADATFDPGAAADDSPWDERSGRRATWGFVGLGVALRVAYYLLDFPLWWDEAFVAVNLLRRGYLDLLRPLDYGQVCPLLFLWAELAAVRLLGFSEWSLRLFPLMAATSSVILFRVAAGRVIQGRGLLISVAIFAVAVHPIRHGADVKPYASDLLAAVALLALAFAWARQPDRAAPIWALAVAGPIAITLSHPAIFVVGGIGLATVRPAWKTKRPGVLAGFAASVILSTVAFGGLYALTGRAQASAASPGMRAMWTRSFPPLDSPTGLIRWLATVHTGDLMAYPIGGERGASGLSLVLCIVGAVVLWRRGLGPAVGCVLAPLGLAIAAAALRRYPYGGPAPHGSAARIMQYAAPGLCLLIGVGSSHLLSLVRSPSARSRALRLGMAGLVVVGIVPVAVGAIRPYRAYQARAARDFARVFWPATGRGAEVADLRWDFVEVAEWDSIRLGIAVSLCDEAIYSPSRRSGGPRFDRVTADRPLKCVLGVAPEVDSPAVVRWLGAMQGRFEIRRRETIEVETAEPGRPSSRERYEVFEFIPKVAGR